MLILNREAGQSIRIGNSITLTVKSLNAGQVEFSVKAPKKVNVYREEIYRRIHGDQKTDKLIGEEVVKKRKRYQALEKILMQRYKQQLSKERPILEINPHIQGTIEKIPEGRHFGFIYTPGMEQTIFFHQSNLTGLMFDDIAEGLDVRFKLMYSERGFFADGIELMS